ncbi:MarR family winged helix-turn-helix transcriptional regulator [Actinoplanes derwentensis]|uniref:DNA-binding transcriptional regulator, MarR family n=1 Tax=Actinoplanes derwentensis TaxID=113562 RepID=A0A1H1YPD4_9ACTN|nr:MarR family transcriptional regulator [Actinoplanes derwentensis]GID81232.1 hypothetical protein Ade03nite_01560 [Actinoplanes derwentensis]SDT23335.1 DNA-binding transcriptional regulator, MarR family [Actinoplanes derwentensis]
MEDAESGRRERLQQAFRGHGTAYAELGRFFGARMGLHTTDAGALVEILSAQDRGAPLTQAALSQRVGLTPGATSSLLNRLEKAGHVARSRDSADRRVVTLRATDGVDTMVDDFFAPLLARIDAMMANHSPEALAHAERFLTDYVATMNGYLADLAAR